MNSSRHSKATAEMRRQFGVGTQAGGKLLTQANMICRLCQQLPAAPFCFWEIIFGARTVPRRGVSSVRLRRYCPRSCDFAGVEVTRLKLKKDRDSLRRLLLSIGGVPDEDFNPVQAARAAKWPGLYFFNGLRSAWRNAASSCGPLSSCSRIHTRAMPRERPRRATGRRPSKCSRLPPCFVLKMPGGKLNMITKAHNVCRQPISLIGKNGRCLQDCW
jgi:hypothetical protein